MATTATAVKQIITPGVSDTVIESLITAADSYMDTVLSSGDLTDTVYDEVQRWLVAHMLSMSVSRQGKNEQLGEAKIEYTGKYGELLRMTSYGQMVLQLDYSGKLGSSHKQGITTIAITEDND